MVVLDGGTVRPDWSEVRSCLLLSMRHLGDAVILSGFVNAIHKRNPTIGVDVLGRADLVPVTRSFCSVRDYISAEFPFYGHHSKNTPAISNAIRKFARVRREKYDVCINLVGDARENVLGNLSGAPNVFGPDWPRDHSFRHHIRNFDFLPFAIGNVRMPGDVPGFYQSMSHFCRELGLPDLCWPRHEAQRESAEGPVVALHPGASRASKQWDVRKWREVIRGLRENNYRVLLFGSRSEEGMLHREFQDEITHCGVECINDSIEGFLKTLATVDVLVGMDSFSVHAAHALGVPAVMLHGPFDPKVMTPPGCIALSAGRLCNQFPCHDTVSCKNTRDQYVCVRAIDVESVLNRVEELLQNRYGGAIKSQTFIKSAEA